MTTCAIHQPNFFPWLGYFDKIKKSDIFVFLDSVDYPKNGGKNMTSICNRVAVSKSGASSWIRIPVQKAPLGTKINKIKINNTVDWEMKIKEHCFNNYKPYAGYKAASEILDEILDHHCFDLFEFNKRAIIVLCRKLNIEANFVLQSSLRTKEKGTKLLVEICQKIKADTYLCGNGAKGYQDDELFKKNQLALQYQNFKPKNYIKKDSFLPGLSILDYMMRIYPWSCKDWSM